MLHRRPATAMVEARLRLGQVKAGIIRALQECNGSRSGPPARAGPGCRDGLDGSLLRKLTLLVAVAARSLGNRTLGHRLPS